MHEKRIHGAIRNHAAVDQILGLFVPPFTHQPVVLQVFRSSFIAGSDQPVLVAGRGAVVFVRSKQRPKITFFVGASDFQAGIKSEAA